MSDKVEEFRKLATIRKIENISEIPKADFIEVAQVDLWELVVKKDEFKEGDLCVYFEIDSFLPEDPRFEFLKDLKTFNGNKGYRLRTIKLRKQISQGLALPLSSFPELKNVKEGDDVTEKLGITKYDVSLVKSKQGNIKVGNTERKFPYFLRKTDQNRIQNLPRYFNTMQDFSFEETMKLDGSSMTCYKWTIEMPWWKKVLSKIGFKFDTVKFGVCSRNLELKRPNDLSKSNFWYAADKYDIESKLPYGFALQGELIGPNIQKNHEKVDDFEYRVFDVWNIKEQRHLNPIERKEFMEEYMKGVLHVPIVNNSIKIFKECTGFEPLMNRVKGQSMNKGTISEGRVYKCIERPEITFKCINNQYLLKCED